MGEQALAKTNLRTFATANHLGDMSEKERALQEARKEREAIIARTQEMEKLKQDYEMWKRIREELAQKQQNMVEKFLESKKKFLVLKNRSLSIAGKGTTPHSKRQALTSKPRSKRSTSGLF